ncbi:DUF2829 domain-containing protein [Xenorhabdus stockiae]|uniref:DUF2829 domain-containing protein n=1 Tax=Xenorhabdus stockiae TaxID=351614 RepID=UPI003CFB4254
MSDVNKLDDKQCPFDPEQYKKKIEIDDIAPAGSFPWAMIKVYSGKQVHRKDWSAPDEYIYLVPGNGSDVAPEVKVRDKHGAVTSWQPTQDDMMSCDWVLLVIKPKPVECMLSFDLEVGSIAYNNGQGQEQDWGYVTKGRGSYSDEYPFGTLTNLKNTIGIGNILAFTLAEFPIGTFSYIELEVDTENQPDLGNKTLEVAVNGSNYNLGSMSAGNPTSLSYASDGAKQLGDLLKQNVGKTVMLPMIRYCDRIPAFSYG